MWLSFYPKSQKCYTTVGHTVLLQSRSICIECIVLCISAAPPINCNYSNERRTDCVAVYDSVFRLAICTTLYCCVVLCTALNHTTMHQAALCYFHLVFAGIVLYMMMHSSQGCPLQYINDEQRGGMNREMLAL